MITDLDHPAEMLLTDPMALSTDSVTQLGSVDRATLAEVTGAVNAYTQTVGLCPDSLKTRLHETCDPEVTLPYWTGGTYHEPVGSAL